MSQTSSFSSDTTSKPTIRIRRQTIWKRILHQAYPLPEAPPEMCRDAFLAELLKPYGGSTPTPSLSSDDSIMSNRVKFGNSIEFTNVEAKLLNQMIRTDRRQTYKRDSVVTESSLYAPDLNKLMKERYGNIATAIGFMSTISELQQLKYRMVIFQELWQMNVSIDKELRLFGWSIKDYLERFSQPNLVYLDTAERLLGKQIECFKFRMDLKEINRLVDAVIEDVRSKRNICNGSMELIKDAEMDIEVLLTNSQKEATEEHAKVAKAAANMPRSADPFGRRAKAIYSKINHFDFVYPIEARYRINWTQTTMEQSILKVEFDEKRLSDELNSIKQQIEEVRSLWKISSVAYNAQIYSLKNSIMDRELQYEENLELAESQIQMSRLRLSKVKDDLKYYKEQIPMFHRKIEEVQEILALQELENRKSKRMSRKSIRKSSGDKLLMKAKK
ncbi:uncharacterized protein LOC133835222 isoform X2 [Drosophila sulfurigaster albostrigata]|uniref:uncharacterized protein LOC133835222 isoform X2 n=1 Tax=Drosophila sulfurigaster albostrigata TaxID=89887 RepID=UPI002D21BA24|nr:uncharacterized protein LOC133835222 isoform X2 [Drosophila sulfurigaster albostrigata]